MSKATLLLTTAVVSLTANAVMAAAPAARGANPSPVRPVVVRERPHGITATEAARLRYQHQLYQQMQRRANADGEVTAREQALLDRKAASLRHLIQVARNN